MKLIECVPNFSEGRSKEFLESITSIVKSNNKVHLLDIDPGIDTNRTVVTFVGDPDNVLDIAYRLIQFSSKNIDMRNHKGEHPRMGATDVCPLIPIDGVSMKECINYSKKLAKKVGDNLNIPIYLYENSAKTNDRINLSNIRKGEYEEMPNKMKSKEWYPDYGPNIFNHKSGCTAIGAREFLIAYNINLNTTNKKIATDIALDIREAGRLKRTKDGTIIRDKNGIGLKKPGKLKFCKAVGWYIDEYKQAQVSINLTNFKKTSIHKTFEEVRLQARKRGIRVTGSEIVGLVPKKSIIDAGKFYLKKQKRSSGIPDDDIINIAIKSLGLNEISEFHINDKIIEKKMSKNDNSLSSLSIRQLTDDISRATPTPGGGSVSALAGSLGASLSAMVSNLTIDKKGYEKHKKLHLNSSKLLQKYKDELLILIDSDSMAYDEVIKSFRMSKKTSFDIKKRDKSIYKATYNAAKIPLKILKLCNKVISETYKITLNGNPNSISDAAVANDLLLAASKGACYNILINITDLSKKDNDYYKNNTDYYFKQIQDTNIKINQFINKSTISLDG